MLFPRGRFHALNAVSPAHIRFTTHFALFAESDADWVTLAVGPVRTFDYPIQNH